MGCLISFRVPLSGYMTASVWVETIIVLSFFSIYSVFFRISLTAVLFPGVAGTRTAPERRSRNACEGNTAPDGGPGVASGGAEASLPRGKFGEGVELFMWATAAHDSTE